MKRLLICLIFLSLPIISFAQEENEVRAFPIYSADPQFLISVIEDVKSTSGKVFYDANNQSLVVVDTPESMVKIEKLLSQLDAPAKMVMITVTTVDVTNEFLSDMGISGGSVVLPQVRFQAVLSALENRRDSHIRSKSTVSVLSNNPARIQVSEDFIIGLKQYVHEPSGTRVTTPIREPIGHILEVLPRVHADNSVTLSIQPTLSSLNDANIPYKREISTKVVINEGDTLVLGGLTRESDTKQSQSSLFTLSSTQNSQENSHLVMFLTVDVED